jgi:hypothetical protein
MVSIPNFRTIVIASPAAALTIAASDVGILWSKLVSLLAVRLFGIETTPTIDVDLRGHGLQVIRVAAAPSAAQMIQFHAVRNRSDEKLVAEPVNVDVPIVTIDHAIISVVSTRQRTSPEPTSGKRLGVNLLLQAFRQRRQSNLKHKRPHDRPSPVVGAIFL